MTLDHFRETCRKVKNDRRLDKQMERQTDKHMVNDTRDNES